MSKFAKMLSASNAEIKEKRAEMLSSKTKLEAQTLLNNLTRDRSELENELVNLTDLAPDNTYSLRPGSAEFKADEWVKSLHRVKMDISLKDIEIKIAQEIFDEWFADTKA
jgi:hypothetical protein